MDYQQGNLNRRKFISQSITGMASLSLLPIMKQAESIANLTKTKSEIIYRTLGKTGIKIPVVSMGAMMTNDPALIRRACEIGIRHFDTAATYRGGRNEEMIGKVIKELNIRDQVYIATKIPRIPPLVLAQMDIEQIKTSLLNQFARCLERLQSDYVDILHLHDADCAEYLKNAGLRSALETIKRQNKAHFIGFSTHARMIECLNEAALDGFYDVVLTAFNYSMCENKELIKAMEQAAAKGIGLIAMKTQCQQPWFHEYEPFDDERFYQGQIMHTALLKWVLRHDFIATAIPGVQNFQELEQDFSVVRDLNYTAKEKQFLQDRNVKLGMASLCQQCYQCVLTCPKNVEIPKLIRSHTYATCYKNFDQARITLNEMPEGRGIVACSICNRCTAKCVYHVDIVRRIDELKTMKLVC